MQHHPPAIGISLANDGRRGQTKVETHLQRQLRVVVHLAAHHAVIVLRPHRPALLDIGIQATGIAANPVQVLAEQHLLVVTGRQVPNVLGLGVELPPLAR